MVTSGCSSETVGTTPEATTTVLEAATTTPEAAMTEIRRNNPLPCQCPLSLHTSSHSLSLPWGRESPRSTIIRASTTDVSVDVAVEEKEKRIPKGETWSVHKFGGTCVGNSSRIKNVANIIIDDDSERKLVVVSAMSKVTDMMYDLIYKAQSRDESYVSALDAVLEKHSSTAEDLLNGIDSKWMDAREVLIVNPTRSDQMANNKNASF
ncbi:bifunctional aspartokinase/homoserine dehydrogenase, chloroplastic-like [Cajanus cajan]|uniref:bifunctional aspartokinase/homoserine dehydrogenase, chloroplastic-like n=1 Tax=Cajanus cajan TaxID=3821 RepID=UPI00098DA67C|nr:bifunctional aspartokinase/homoserine dehydrogenase, chloroplastic-like [Cajanus cajan]